MKIKLVRVYQAVYFEGRPRSNFKSYEHTDREEPTVNVLEDEKGVLIWTKKDAVRIGWPNISSLQYDMDTFTPPVLAQVSKPKSDKKA